MNMFADLQRRFDAALASGERAYLSLPKESKPAFVCSECGEGIYFDDAYYPIGGVNLCEDCIKTIRRTVGEDDFC